MKNKRNIRVVLLLFCLLANTYLIAASPALKNEAVISGKLDPAKFNVTLKVLGEFGNGNGNIPTVRQLRQDSAALNFEFKFAKLEKPIYVTIIYKNPYTSAVKNLLHRFPLEAGDTVLISFDEQKQDFTFSGKSAFKFNWFYELEKQTIEFQAKMSPNSLKDNPAQIPINLNAVLNFKLQSLLSIKNNFSPATYQLMRVDMMSRIYGSYYRLLVLFNFGYAYGKENGNNALGSFNLQNEIPFNIDAVTAVNSSYYADYVLQKTLAIALYERYTKDDQIAIEHYQKIKALTLDGQVRDKVLLSFLHMPNTKLNMDSIRKDAMKIVTNPKYKQVLLGLIENSEIGKPIQDFDFVNNKGKSVKLDQYKGKLVLVDIWFTGCPGCIDVAKEMVHIEEEFKGNDRLVFVSLSIDKDKEKWLNSIKDSQNASSHKYTYTHFVSQETNYLFTGGSGSFNPFIKRYNPTNNYPRLLLIDEEGNMLNARCPLPFGGDSTAALISLLKNAIP